MSELASKLVARAVSATRACCHSLFLATFLLPCCGPRDDWRTNFPFWMSREQRRRRQLTWHFSLAARLAARERIHGLPMFVAMYQSRQRKPGRGKGRKRDMDITTKTSSSALAAIRQNMVAIAAENLTFPSPFFDTCAMTLSIRDPSSSWDRTLPKPTAILQNLPAGAFARRSSSLLQHHLVSRNFSQETLESDVGRRSTVPCIPNHARRMSGAYGGQARMVDGHPREPVLLPNASLETLMRKRDESHMAEESQSRPESPSNASVDSGAKEFCLCQPDPKIPRPRNGTNSLRLPFLVFQIDIESSTCRFFG